MQFIVAEVENGDGLPRARSLRAITLIEQRRIMAVRTKSNRRRKTIGAANVSGNGQSQSSARWEIYAPCSVGSSGDYEDRKYRCDGEREHNSWAFH
jgi:hypothetical protein